MQRFSASQPPLRWFLPVAAVLLTGLVWMFNTLVPDQLQTSVDTLHKIPWLESRWLYAWLLAFTGTFPLLFGFLPQLKFHRVWGILLLANLPVSAFFIFWDAWFTSRGVWGFSPAYTSGIDWFGLPWEECMFFVIIPAACIFIYWSINAVTPTEPFRRIERPLTVALALVFLILGAWKWDHIYTATTSLLSGFFLVGHFLFVPSGYRGRFYLAYLVSCIPFLLINGALTGAFTEGPVVLYNPDEYFGIRVQTIPVDDFGYSFLMLFANVTLFEALMARRPDLLPPGLARK